MSLILNFELLILIPLLNWMNSNFAVDPEIAELYIRAKLTKKLCLVKNNQNNQANLKVLVV